MAKSCDLCGKTYQKANLVPRGIGNRVTRRTTTKKAPNLRNKRLQIGGRKIRAVICASCLKTLKREGVIPTGAPTPEKSTATPKKKA
jgi:ribosomal protein L28